MYINGQKAYPKKEWERGQLCLTVKLLDDSQITLFKGDKKIYEKVYKTAGDYQFIINKNEEVDVIKMTTIVKDSNKLNDIKDENEKIQSIIKNIPNWDEI